MRRLGLSLLLVVVAAVIGAGWAMDGLFDRLGPDTREPLRTARELGTAFARTLDHPDVSGADDTVRTMPRAALPLPAELAAMLDAGEPLALESAQGVTLYIDLPTSARVLALDLPARPSTGTRLRLALTLAFYAALVLLIMVWLYPLLRRLQRLSAGARAFGEGDLAHRIATGPQSALHGIEAEFNRMARRIDGLIADNRLLRNAVSHDLRTPLARLRFGIDALTESDDGPERARYLERIDADLGAMEELVEVLLEFGRLERRLHELPLTVTDLAVAVSRAVDAERMGGADTIVWRVPPTPLPALADERYATMLVGNLLRNALQHAGTRVRVGLRAEPGIGDETIRLDVEDDGPGIDEHERTHVVEPFVRGSGAMDTTGHGLGLAIVARIVDWHGATLEIGRSEALGGARISVRFRRAERSRGVVA